MHSLRILATVAALAAAATAQSPITTLFSGGNGGSAGWMNQFDITANTQINLTAFDLNISSGAGAQGTIDVYVTALGGTYNGNQLNSAVWTLVGQSATFTANAPNTPTNAVMNAPISLAPGTYGMAILYNGVSMSYTNGNGANQMYSNAEVTLNLGCSTTALFGGSIFTPRVWNGAIYYQTGSNYAGATTYGQGCGGGAPSTFYEIYSASNPFDLSNTGFTMFANAGGGYTVAPVANPIVTPTGAPVPFGDDQTQQIALPFAFPYPGGTTNSIWLCSNGWMSFEATTAVDLSGTGAGLVGGTARLAFMWDDLNPAAGGTVNCEVDPSNPTQFHVTFLGVPEYSVGGSNDIQITLDAGGNLAFSYGSCTSSGCLAGFSRGHAVRDPGGIDITAAVANAFQLGDDRPNLSLVSVARPVIGQLATVRTRNIPANSPAGFVLIGFTALNPGVDLTPINMTGCHLYVNGDVSQGFPVTGSTADFSLMIPANPSLAGLHLYLQSGVIAPGANPFGVTAANGMDWLMDVN